jgi:LuxR family transcriptional regulator, quorum-sensing system regulator CciR
VGACVGSEPMGPYEDVQDFVRAANRAASLSELEDLLAAAAATMGFHYFALGHHVTVLSGDMIQLGNYPESWLERIFYHGYLSIDPALMAARHTVLGFSWADIPNFITLSGQQKRILEESHIAGFGEGFTVPIHLPGECAASCTFVTKYGQSIDLRVAPAAHYIGCFAFEAARRLRRNAIAANEAEADRSQVPSLSGRQLDCIVLAARGKSATDSGQLLGISPGTVHQHLETAKRRYGVATRTQLIVRALFDSQLTFRDVISP